MHFRAGPRFARNCAKISTEIFMFCERCAKIYPRDNFLTLYFEKKLYKTGVLAKNLREIARKLVPNLNLYGKVRENKSARKFLIFAQTKCAKISTNKVVSGEYWRTSSLLTFASAPHF